MVVHLHPAALAELGEAVAFYEERASGLGFDLFAEVERVLRDIAENPELGSSFEPPYRRVLCRRFPFSVVYRVGSEKATVMRSCIGGGSQGTGGTGSSVSVRIL